MAVVPPMSILMKAVRSTLQSVLSVDKTFCDIDPDTRPSPVMGDYKISIGPGPQQRENGNEEYLTRSLSVEINVTVRISPTPRDRRNYTYFEKTASLEALSEKVIAIVQNRAVITAANTLIGSTTEKFQTTLVLSQASQPRIEDGSWADCDPDQAAFMVQTLRFDSCIIVQKQESLYAAATT